jgi:outer membrane lipoprotein SlyB
MMHSFLALMLAASLLAGCASTPGDDNADARRTQQQAEQKQYSGVVESVREVEMDSEGSGVAPMAGAVIGGTAGSSVGRGKGAAMGGAVGTIVGAVTGEAVAQTGTRPALEITVRLDAGRVIAVTQPAGNDSFKPGERVRVVSDGRTARVAR